MSVLRHGIGRVSAICAAALLLSLTAGCEGELGACEGWSDILSSGYCYDDWTEDECDDYDAEGVNGADWHFHGGQTCSERGY